MKYKKQVLQKLKLKQQKQSKCMKLKANKKTYKIASDDIIFIQSQNEYLMYHTKSNGRLMVYGTMKSIEEILPKSHFYRIHRSYIVNKTTIKFIEGNQVALQNNTRLPIGENYKNEFMKKW